MSLAIARSIDDFEISKLSRKLMSNWLEIEKIIEGNDDVDENQFEEVKELTASKPSSSLPKPKTERSKFFKGILARMIRRYGYMFRHMRHSFMLKKYIEAISDVVHHTLKKMVRPMVDKTTNDIVKKNLSTVVVEAIRLEKEMVKADIAAMVDEAVRKEHEYTRAKLSLQVTNDVANHVPTQVDSFLRNYMSSHILHVHPKEAASSSIPDLQRQLYLKMKDDEQAKRDDLPVWLSLMYKFERSTAPVEPYRVFVVRTHDHEYHHDDDDYPQRESSAKRQKTFEHGTYTTSIDDDEVPFEEVSPELLAEVSGKEMTTDDLQRIQNALNVMMRSQYDLGKEHQYHLDQIKSYIESQIVWESRKEDLTLQIPKKPTQ
ncbi:hypothetical protein Tco_0585679, partial [Tanacetum coccineum]